MRLNTCKGEMETGYKEGRNGNEVEGMRRDISLRLSFFTVESQNQDNVSHIQNVNDGNKQDMEGSPKQNTSSNKWAYVWAYMYYN